jgi:transcriptional regulator of acetoin/glycerol metabolism
MFESKKDSRKELLSEALVKNDGNIRRAAADIGYSRRHVFRLIAKYHLWPGVNELRRCAVEKRRQS